MWGTVIDMDAPSVGRIGDYIKEQREHASLSLRRLAAEAGVSNPYLSQVERGLRKPSAEILQQLAKALRISAEQLYIQAGLLEDKGASLAVHTAIFNDLLINERQKRVLLDIYASFLHENGVDEQSCIANPEPRTTPRKSASNTSCGKASQSATKKATKKSAKSTSKKTTSKKTTPKKTTKKAATKKAAKKVAKKSTARPSRSSRQSTK
jgi:transcriptional regulator with XRE-family HTH domain